MNSKLLLFGILCLFAVTSAIEECYECDTYEANDKGQCENFNAATSPKSKCRDLLNYSKGNNSRGNGIIRTLITVRENESVQYGCIKVITRNTTDNKDYYERTCVKRVGEVHNDCDLLKEKIPPNVKIVTCNICTNEDNCNGASYLVQSFVLIVFAIFIARI